MLKLPLTGIFLILLVLAALTACSDPAPTPETAVEPTREAVAATSPPPANTPEPTSTTAHTPTISPTPTPGVLSPMPTEDRGAVLSSLSDVELTCIGGDAEKMIAALTGGGPTSMEEQTRLIGCLDDDTVQQLFMTTIIPVPLSVETSNCVLAALDVIDPRAVMTAGLEGDPGTAMAGSMAVFTVSVACLNDEEWAAAAPKLGMGPEDRDGMVCIMAALGGPTEMATAMTEAMKAEDVAEGTALYAAGLECGMEPGPEPADTPGPATPKPAATAEAATPAATQNPASDITSTTTLLPDLVIEIEARLKSNPEIEWGDGCIIPSSSTSPWHVAEITAHVRNVGGKHAGSFVVQVNNAETETVDGLEAGAYIAVVFFHESSGQTRSRRGCRFFHRRERRVQQHRRNVHGSSNPCSARANLYT